MSMKLSFLLLLLVAILKSEVQGLEHVVDDGRQIEGDSRVERRVDSLSHLDQKESQPNNNPSALRIEARVVQDGTGLQSRLNGPQRPMAASTRPEMGSSLMFSLPEIGFNSSPGNLGCVSPLVSEPSCHTQSIGQQSISSADLLLGATN
ncbi:hypothetical protein V6N12_036439 [Hibiscus sabdariffa]|uniref:Uncharacterized protein n=1 Tax=Hibiscus sabdariffa TaxID=183260 RepID=A0ABR2EQP6_9ROSI